MGKIVHEKIGRLFGVRQLVGALDSYQSGAKAPHSKEVFDLSG
jgi:hypothetical protein